MKRLLIALGLGALLAGCAAGHGSAGFPTDDPYWLGGPNPAQPQSSGGGGSGWPGGGGGGAGPGASGGGGSGWGGR